MLTPRIYQLLGWCFKYSELFRIIPYEWDESKHVLKPVSSKKHIVICYSVNVVFLCHLIHLVFGLYNCIVSQDETLTFYVGESVYVLGFFLGFILQITLFMKRHEYVRFINHFIPYFEQIRGNI